MAPDLPFAGNGDPDSTTRSTRTAHPARRRALVAGLCLLVTGAVGFGLAAPSATADSLTQQRDRVKQQLAQKRQDLNESTSQLNKAVAAVEAAESKLTAARTELAQTRRDLAAATRRDAAMALKLKQTQAALAKAKAKVVEGQRLLDAEHATLGAVIRDQYQQQTNLLPIAILTSSSSLGDFQTRIQWSTTMTEATQAQIERLQELQRQLEAEKTKAAALEVQVAEQRKAAAAQLKVTASLEQRAETQAAAVATLVRQARSAQASAAGDVAADKEQYAALQSERSTVESRIAARIAAQKAAAARAAAQERARAKAKKSSSGRSSSGGSSSGRSSSGGSSSGGSSGGGSASHGFIYPVNAPITSPYGMRFHPVLHYWKLHDGTDFGAGCGTPIRAAYSGRVAERYFNGGYGNRLMIDHGRVDGHYITTGYNHAIRYVVSVGQHVSQGQVIGYVGTTGYSTGCHLHLMVWEDGSMINPMTWY